MAPIFQTVAPNLRFQRAGPMPMEKTSATMPQRPRGEEMPELVHEDAQAEQEAMAKDGEEEHK
jgi:hypothetical protein